MQLIYVLEKLGEPREPTYVQSSSSQLTNLAS
jgi:hypothetical protein